MRRTATVVLLLLAMASLLLFTQAAVQAKSKTDSGADLCIDRIWLDTQGYINVAMRNCGKEKIDPAKLGKAKLVVKAGKDSHALLLNKIDRKARLASPGGKQTYRLPQKIKGQLVVTATIYVPKGLFDESNTKNNSRTAKLKPASSTPRPAVQIKPTAQAVKPVAVKPQVKPTPQIPRLRITGLSLANNHVVVKIKRLDKTKINSASLAKAKLVVTYQGKSKAYPMTKVDPGARKLSGTKGEVHYRTDAVLTKRGLVTASLRGLGSQPIYRASLTPVIRAAAVNPVAGSNAAAPPVKPNTQIKPTAQIKPTPVAAVVRVKDIALVGGTIRVTLERWGAAKVPSKALSLARLTVTAHGKRHSFNLNTIDPAGRKLNDFKKQVVFNTGIKLDKTSVIRAQLSGIGAISIKTAQLRVKPAPEPPEPAATRTAQTKVTVFPGKISLEPGKSTQLTLRGARVAKVAKVRILHDGKPVKGISSSLANNKLQISSNSQKLPSGQYELVLLNRANKEIQRLPLGLSFIAPPRRLGGPEPGALRVRLISDEPRLVNNWARQMHSAGLLQAHINPNVGGFVIRPDNTLEWSRLAPGEYTFTISGPPLWELTYARQTRTVRTGGVSQADVVIKPLYRLHGTVNNYGRPAQGVSQIWVERLDPPAGYPTTLRTPSVNQNGEYSVIVDAGRYRITPLVPRGSDLAQAIPHIATVPSGSRQELRVDFDLAREQQASATPTPDNRPMDSRPIQGVVRLADGSGADGVTIEVEGIDHPNLRTDENGEFQTQGIRQNVRVAIVPRKDGWDFSPRRAAATPSAGHIIEFVATPTHLARFVINGTIQADGRPLAGVTVYCGDQTATTAQSGVFAFRDLPRGQYIVRPELEGYAFQPAIQNIEINDRNALNNAFVANRIAPAGNAFIAGNLWENERHQGLGGEQMKLYYCTGGNDPNCSARVAVPGSNVALTATDGHFVFRGLGRGRYVVVPPSVLTTRIMTRFQPRERIVNLGDQSVSGVDFINSYGGTYNPQSISGRFSTLDDSPIPDNINLRVESCDSVSNPNCQRTNAQVRINPDGSFIIWDVPPGVTKLAPTAANYTFEPASLLMINHARQTDNAGRFVTRRDVGRRSVGNLTVQLSLGRDVDSYPQVVWLVEYLNQGDVTEYIRRRPQAYQAQSQCQAASDPVTGTMQLSQLPTGTYKVSAASIHPQGQWGVSDGVTYIYVSPGLNTMRVSVVPIQ